ncbi:hypothetical protein ACIQ4I_05645 [Rummeliibacillus sp. NPDC094406]|uniref:hypothetical protein n=1 Tax=Rummeliibacillus sp. NPDC094406 TaxID=3364511 RepID=UPI0038218430
MLTRKKARKRRAQLIFKQTALHENNCQGCVHNGKNVFANCKDCPVLQRLQVIGTELESISKELDSVVQSSKDKGITPTIYKNLVYRGYNDIEISNLADIPIRELNIWKKNIGVTRSTIAN